MIIFPCLFEFVAIFGSVTKFQGVIWCGRQFDFFEFLVVEDLVEAFLWRDGVVEFAVSTDGEVVNELLLHE